MNSETLSKDLENWKREDVLNLANHFHKWCPKTEQHKRVYHFEMEKQVVAEFNELDEIERINICLALHSERSDERFTFYPLLEIHLQTTEPVVFLPLIGREAPIDEKDIPLSDIVPGIFKEMITKNWHTIETGLIDDLFLARKQEDALLGSEMVRVHYFEIGERMIKHINGLRALGPVDGVIVYPGVDMNKMIDKSMISFTPILGIKHAEHSASNAEQGVIESVEKETFIEYSSPCPPTCGRKKITRAQ